MTSVLVLKEGTQIQGECYVKETETGVMLPQAKGCQGLLATRRSQKTGMKQIPSLGPKKESVLPPPYCPISSLQYCETVNLFCVFLIHLTRDSLLQQPWETNASNLRNFTINSGTKYKRKKINIQYSLAIKLIGKTIMNMQLNLWRSKKKVNQEYFINKFYSISGQFQKT